VLIIIQYLIFFYVLFEFDLWILQQFCQYGVIYLQMMTRLVNNENEWCGIKDNGIILGFILCFIKKMTTATVNLSKIGTPVLENANICVEFTATFDKGR